MWVVLSNSSQVPLYEQIKEQIGAAILGGELAEGAALPSVRALARDLRISVITMTRAYTELAAEGFIATPDADRHDGGRGSVIEVLGHRVPTPVALRQDVGVVLDYTYLVGEWRLS
jgi:DNA-binding transcriptional regulator YhcF (GntR family)